MTTLSQKELDEIYVFAVDVGKNAGQMLIDAAQIRVDGGNGTEEQKEHVQKENAVDLVTETDENVEAYIKQRINEKYPSHKYVFHPTYFSRRLTLLRFVGEESYSKGASRDYLIDDSPTWCVDPLDGKPNLLKT